MKTLLIYGGSFDPPHWGHIKTAQAVQAHFNFDNVVFLPCKCPVLKAATLATPEQRVEMLQLAIQDKPKFTIDCREIQRETPSFMVETLESFRAELGDTIPITLLIGQDAFLELSQWHRGNELLNLAHLLVIHRPPAVAGTNETLPSLMLTRPAGTIYHFNAGEYPIASRQIRARIKAGHSVRGDLPENVNRYINEHGLYR